MDCFASLAMTVSGGAWLSEIVIGIARKHTHHART
jgi:hypothetical protein